jgi:hypothetical protein
LQIFSTDGQFQERAPNFATLKLIRPEKGVRGFKI